MSDVTFDMKKNKMTVHKDRVEPWTVTLVDTGDNSMTGGRLLRIKEYVKDDEAFCFTYGDGLSDVDISETIEFHKRHQKLATLTSTYLPGRFGALTIDNKRVKSFEEKPRGDGGMINGGYFVLSPRVFDLINGDETTWEEEPLAKLAENEQLMAFQHKGFWHPMDTLRDKQKLQKLWEEGNAPWRQYK